MSGRLYLTKNMHILNISNDRDALSLEKGVCFGLMCGLGADVQRNG